MKKKLLASNSILDTLEPGGGMTASSIRHSANEESNPDFFVNTTQDGTMVTDAVTVQELERLATEPEIISITSRIHSYIVVKPKTFSTFATMQLDSSNPLFGDIEDVDIFDEVIQDTWMRLQSVLWSKKSGAKTVTRLLSMLYTYGKVYAFIIRGVKGEPIGIEFSHNEAKRGKDGRSRDVITSPGGNVITRDEDIIECSYRDIDNHALSYIAYVRPQYNLYRAIEKTRIANAIMAAQFRSIYKVPTTKLTKNKAKARLSTIFSKWKRDIRIDMRSGEIHVNGKSDWQVGSQLWTTETSSGAPSIENPGDGNPMLDSMDIVNYFNKKFYKLSKLPLSKYEAVDMSFLGDISANDEDERQFELFISKNREVLTEFFKLIVLCWLHGNPISENEDIMNLIGMTFFDDINSTKLQDELAQIDTNLDAVNSVTTKIREIMDLSVDDIPELLEIDAQISGHELDFERLELALILAKGDALKNLATKVYMDKLQDQLDAKGVTTGDDPADDADVPEETPEETEARESKGAIIAKFMKSSGLGKPIPAMEAEDDWGNWDDSDWDTDSEDEWDDSDWNSDTSGSSGDSGGFDTPEGLSDADVEEVEVEELALLSEEQIDGLKELISKRLELLRIRRKMAFDKLQKQLTKRMVAKYVPNMLQMTTAFSDLADMDQSQIAKALAEKEIMKAKKSMSRAHKVKRGENRYQHEKNINSINKANQDVQDQSE